MGNNGCVSIIGGRTQWNNFLGNLTTLSRESIYSTLASGGFIHINVMTASRPTLIKL